MRYLDPKADLTFKKIFGEHPDLVISFLNALLPLKEGEEITGIEYLPSELVPDTPLGKNSIVDVRCKDTRGRQFIVEMQMIWSQKFQYRVLFNASKAYVRQLDKNEDYNLLQPVYSLNLLNEVFEPTLEGYYHHYRMVHVEHSDKVIDGLQLVFVELPKFTPKSYRDKKMHILWLRFLTEISEKTRTVPQELLENSDIHKAVTIVEESAFTPEQLDSYDRFWDKVRVERTLMNESKEEGRAEGLQQGIQQGLQQGIQQGILVTARNLKTMGMNIKTIAQATGLSIEEIAKL